MMMVRPVPEAPRGPGARQAQAARLAQVVRRELVARLGLVAFPEPEEMAAWVVRAAPWSEQI